MGDPVTRLALVGVLVFAGVALRPVITDDGPIEWRSVITLILFAGMWWTARNRQVGT